MAGHAGQAGHAGRAGCEGDKAGRASRKVRTNSIVRAGVVGSTSRRGKQERQVSMGRQAG